MTGAIAEEEAGELGFLTVLGVPRTGLVGGLLILNRLGRPIEFHCTAPLRPNRAEEILYGASLEPFLCGERIAPALLGKAKTKLFALLTDSSSVLTLSSVNPTPLFFLLSGDEPVSLPDGWQTVSRGKKRLAAPESLFDGGRLSAPLETELVLFEKAIDLAEPFRRIGLAIEESQRS